MADSAPLPEIPTELRPLIAHGVAGWNFTTATLGSTMPTDLQRANRVRRGALLFLTVPRKTKR